MGEYAKYNGQQVKIGTCEDMYYLRADQAGLVSTLPGNVDPIKDRDAIRFRFPFPDEDNVKPGSFDPYERAIALRVAYPITSFDHYSIQFSNPNGYLLSLPCPESNDPALASLKIHRNGWRGAHLLTQQRYREGRLVIVCMCGGCGAKYRVETLTEAEPYIVAARSEADRREPAFNAQWWHILADRMTAGYSA